MTDQILHQIAQLQPDGYFITCEIRKNGQQLPVNLNTFIREKYNRIKHGLNVRKFIYDDGGWRLILTFFPTDEVVSERYALKNKVMNKKLSLNAQSFK